MAAMIVFQAKKKPPLCGGRLDGVVTIDMLGTVRFVLAGLVVLNHLWAPTANLVGAHAVVAFYIVSGYLMTKVIQETYGLSLSGAGRFLTNRFLRIFPIYWFCLLATLSLLLIYGDQFTPYSLVSLPSLYDLFRNVTLFDLVQAPSILVPPAWSLTIEFVFYIMMAALLSRSKTISAVWFAVSLAFTIYLIATGANFSDRYYPATAASLFFSIGAMLYWVKSPSLSARALWPLLALFCVWPLLVHWSGFDRAWTGYYGATVLFIPVFLMANTAPSKTDKWLGDLAYPLFLSHFLCSGIVRILLPGIQPLGLTFLVLSFTLSVVLSISLVKAQSATLEHWRRKIRNSNPQFELTASFARESGRQA